MGSLICIGQPAGNLLLLHRFRICGKGKRDHPVISELLLHLGKINTPPVHPGRRPCLKPIHFYTESFQRIRQVVGCLQPVGTCRIAHIAINTPGPQVGAGCQNHSSAVIDGS